jgi:hypothetical protein
VGKLCFECCIIVLYPWVGEYETDELFQNMSDRSYVQQSPVSRKGRPAKYISSYLTVIVKLAHVGEKYRLAVQQFRRHNHYFMLRFLQSHLEEKVWNPGEVMSLVVFGSLSKFEKLVVIFSNM